MTARPTVATAGPPANAAGTTGEPARPSGTSGGPGSSTGTPAHAAPDARAVATAVRTAVLAVPGVTRLASGSGGVEVSTQFPGGTIPGIRLGDPVEVHVEVAAVPIGPLAGRVRAAVRHVLDGFGQHPSVEVVVDDIDLPEPSAGG
ncbi:hypothetical protein [Micromonospora sp. HM5-17]|jgi:hypothetical protein|uniref:hypothetical protein n=1 Tax=Micromonospora sp. HM5-17 TaxID=2487710 RepID=UPI000F4859B1|nr:hypothetical protein [Micromonospora sp. HM5-17]ROT28292.1 hypothetical protein EF879_22090 [Micromonospora sp. HM5-17]